MSQRKWTLRPSPAMVVACLALLVAMSGVGYAAVKLKRNAVKAKHIAAGAVTTPKLAPDAKAPLAGAADSAKNAEAAKSAADASKLGGTSASGYQKFCEAGAIKGSIVVDTAGMAATYAPFTAFNCAQPGNVTTSVEARRVSQGVYNVRFIGNTGSGTGVITASDTATATGVFPGDPIIGQYVRAPDPTIGGEVVFQVQIRHADSTGVEPDDGGFTDGQKFTLVVL